MTEQQERDLAWRLAAGSDVLTFEKALGIVEFDPAEAERLIRLREENERREVERARLRERRRRALIEDFG